MSEVIYYEKFSDNAVFEDKLLNVTFNQFYTFLINSLGEDFVTQNLLLDGDTAFILQGGVVSGSLRSVELITASKKLFNFIKNSYSSLNISQIIISENLIIMVINEKRILINFSAQFLNATIIDGIYVKTITI